MAKAKGFRSGLIGPLLVAAIVGGLLGGGVVWLLLGQGGAPGSDSSRINVLDLRISRQADQIRELTEEINRLSHRANPGPRAEADRGQAYDDDGRLPPLLEDRDNSFGGYADLMLLSARRLTNNGLKTIPQRRLVSIFGSPAAELGQDCTPPTSERLNAALITRNVGPFKARMVRPAVESLERIFAKVKKDEPALYDNLRSYGALCARLIRGSTERISRHAFGMAIDISVGGTIDAMGDGKTQFGLILMAEYFQEEGWLWGAAFGREDSMHFEISSTQFEKWLSEGLI